MSHRAPSPDVLKAADGLSSAQHDRAVSWVGVFSEAWATGEWHRLLEVVHADASVFYPGMAEVVDREGLREFFEGGFALMPDFRIRLERWAAMGDDVLIEWNATGTIGEEPIRWSGMDRFTFDGDAIIEARAYYDPRPILEAVERNFSD